MVVDTSAIMAILGREPEEGSFRSAMKAAERRLLSAATKVELGIVAFARAGEPGLDQMRTLLDQLRVETVETTEHQADEAIDAFRRFGRGRHPAALNLGDCFSYALAKATGEPLLFKGNDFARTDVVSAG